MAEAYAKLIMMGKKTIDDVPEKLKAKVREILAAAGYESDTEKGDA